MTTEHQSRRYSFGVFNCISSQSAKKWSMSKDCEDTIFWSCYEAQLLVKMNHGHILQPPTSMISTADTTLYETNTRNALNLIVQTLHYFT